MRRPGGGARSLAHNLVALASGELSARVVWFVSTAILTRVITQGEFGVFSLTLSVVGFALLLTDFGSETVAVRELAVRRHRGASLLRELLLVRGGYAAVALVGLLAVAAWVPFPTATRPLLLIAAPLIVSHWLNPGWIFRGQERMAPVAAASLVAALVFAVGVWWLATARPALSQIMWLYVMGFVVAMLLLWILAPELTLRGDGAVSRSQIARLIRQSAPLGCSFFLVVVLQQAGTVLLGLSRTEAEVGLYGAAKHAMLAVLAVVGAAAHDAVFPVISRLLQDRPSLERFQALWARFLFALAVPLGVGSAMVAAPLLALVFGQPYAAGGATFSLLMAATAVAIIDNLYARLLMAADRMPTYLGIVAAQTTCFLAVAVVTIPTHGAPAAAAAVLVAEVVGLFLYPRFSRAIAVTPLLSCLPRPLLAAGAMAAFLWVTPSLAVLLRIAGAALIYGTILFLTGGLRVAQLRELFGYLPVRSPRPPQT